MFLYIKLICFTCSLLFCYLFKRCKCIGIYQVKPELKPSTHVYCAGTISVQLHHLAVFFCFFLHWEVSLSGWTWMCRMWVQHDVKLCGMCCAPAVHWEWLTRLLASPAQLRTFLMYGIFIFQKPSTRATSGRFLAMIKHCRQLLGLHKSVQSSWSVWVIV